MGARLSRIRWSAHATPPVPGTPRTSSSASPPPPPNPWQEYSPTAAINVAPHACGLHNAIIATLACSDYRDRYGPMVRVLQALRARVTIDHPFTNTSVEALLRNTYFERHRMGKSDVETTTTLLLMAVYEYALSVAATGDDVYPAQHVSNVTDAAIMLHTHLSARKRNPDSMMEGHSPAGPHSGNTAHPLPPDMRLVTQAVVGLYDALRAPPVCSDRAQAAHAFVCEHTITARPFITLLSRTHASISQ